LALTVGKPKRYQAAVDVSTREPKATSAERGISAPAERISANRLRPEFRRFAAAVDEPIDGEPDRRTRRARAPEQIDSRHVPRLAT
jgi:hypothetical protein